MAGDRQKCKRRLEVSEGRLEVSERRFQPVARPGRTISYGGAPFRGVRAPFRGVRAPLPKSISVATEIDLGRPPAGVGTVAPRQFPRKPGGGDLAAAVRSHRSGGSRCGSEIPLAVVPELSRRDSSKGGCRQAGRAGVKISQKYT